MKEQKIKEQFQKWEQSLQAPPLELDHERRFLTRLQKKKLKSRQKRLLQWAAVALLCIGLSSVLQYIPKQNSSEVLQFQKAEFYLMQHIEEQITSFEKEQTPENQEILIRSKQQLLEIQNNYHQIYKKWGENPDQTQLIQAIISNLNTQINLLNDINITLQNLKNRNHEEYQI